MKAINATSCPQAHGDVQLLSESRQFVIFLRARPKLRMVFIVQNHCHSTNITVVATST